MYVLNNQSLDRKILETDPNLYLTSYEVDLYWQIFHGKKIVSIKWFFPMEYLFRRMSYVHTSGGVRASVLSYQRPPKQLVCQFRYDIGGEMHFYQENTKKIFWKATIHRKIINLKTVQQKILILAYCVLQIWYLDIS